MGERAATGQSGRRPRTRLGDGADEGSGAASYFTAPLASLVVYPRFLDLVAATLATVLVAF